MVSRVAGGVPFWRDRPQDAWDLPIEVGTEDDQCSVDENDLSHPTHLETEKRTLLSGELITASRVAEFINSL